MFKKLTIVAAMMASTTAIAAETPIYGSVESKCSIFTDVQGVYAQPTPDELTTVVSDGGVMPKIRFDVAQADYYIAKVSYPTEFTTSPSLTDSVVWEGEVEVAEVSDPLMSAYDTDKITYNNVTEFDLTVAGTVWFKVTSVANYGYGKAFPAGNYQANVVAECIAQ